MADNWSSIELKHLYALAAVARTGTFWAAADVLDVSQSSVSDHIAQLEALTGQRLVERSRGKRTVELTEAGRVLLGHGAAISARLSAAEADLAALAAGEAGELRVGVYQSVANKVLPEAMRGFQARWPKVDVRLTESDDDAGLLGAVEDGRLDLTVAVEPIPDGPFASRHLMRDPYVLVVAAGSPLAGRRPSIAELDGVEMVGYQIGRTWEMAESHLAVRGVRPRFVFRTNDNGTVQAMVAAGIGVAMVPLLTTDEQDARTEVVELREPIPPRRLAIVRHRDRYRTPASVAFEDLAAEVASRVEARETEFLAGQRAGARR